MDVERVAVFAGVGFAIAIVAFIVWGPTPKPKRGKVVGINNLGYTCFLNALLQALAASPTFITWLKRHRDKTDKSDVIPSLLSVFEKINGYAEDLYGDVTPVEIISSLGPLWTFAPDHQDAHELFHVILNALQNEIQPPYRNGSLSDALPGNTPITPDMKGSGDPLTFRSVSCNDIVAANKSHSPPNGFDRNCNNHIMTSTPSIPRIPYAKPGMILARSSELLSRSMGDAGDSEVPFRSWNSVCTVPCSPIPSISVEVHPFSGLLTSQLQCSNCKWKSAVRYDKLETISLPLPPRGVYAKSSYMLEELLARFVTSETVPDVMCDGCSTRCLAMKTLTIGKLPKCLCLHISRTTWSSSGIPIKRDDPVKFPTVLVLDPYTFTETKKRCAKGGPESSMLLAACPPKTGKHEYQLCAVIEHRGEVDSGHFVCYRRENRPNQWLFTSDTIVVNVGLREVLYATPYLLFYERINNSTTKS